MDKGEAEELQSLALSFEREEISRSQFFYRVGLIAGAMGLGSFGAATKAAGSGFARTGARASTAATLAWAQESGIDDPSFLKGFTEATIRTIQIVSEATMVSQIARHQVSPDVSLVSQGYSENYWYPANLLQPLNHSDYSHWNELMPHWQTAAPYYYHGQLMAIPNIWGTDSIMYNTKTISSVTSVATLFDPSLKGQIAMPGNGVESIAIAGQYIGAKNPFAPTTKELAAIKKALLKQKPLVRSYWTTIGDLVNLLTTGEVTVAHGWLAIYTEAKNAGVPLKWAIPKEGQIGWSNGNGILKSTKNMDTSKAFMDFLISTNYLMPVYKKLGYRTTSMKLTKELTPKERNDLQLNNIEALLKTVVPWITAPPALGKKLDDVWAEVVAA